MTETLNKIRYELKKKNNLIHCITNPISINQCANLVLAVGARPIMAEHPKEVKEITKEAKALLLNLGNITDARIKSIQISAKCAEKFGIPITLDLVGIGCSRFRYKLAYRLLKKRHISTIKGNYSEIYALFESSYRNSGVDSESLEIEKINFVAAELAKKYNCIVLASGKTDIITNGERLIHIKNGTAKLTDVTGTGCMLGTLCSCFLSVRDDIFAAACACSLLGICGELACAQIGSGSFMTELLDRLSTLSVNEFEKYINWEEIKIEKA